MDRANSISDQGISRVSAAAGAAAPEVSPSRVVGYISILGGFYRMTEGGIYLAFMFPVLFIALLNSYGLSRELSVSSTWLYSLTALGLALCAATYVYSNRLHNSMKGRLAESQLAERLDAGLLERDEIFRRTPALWRWMLDRPRWGDPPEPDRPHLLRLVRNLDWYTAPPRRLMRWHWVALTLVLVLYVADALLVYVLPTAIPGWIVQSSTRLLYLVFGRPGALLLLLWLFALPAVAIRQMHAVWHTELLRYLREYVAANQAAASEASAQAAL